MAKKLRPLPGFARHFAFSETGQAGHTLRVCCFAPKIRCAHSGAPLANPAPSVPLKNTNSNANNWRICVFLTRHSDGPGTPTANEVAFSVARETVRMTFARSHAARVPENGIWNRAANRAPAVAGEIISAQRLSARTRCEMLACVQARNPIAPGAIPNIIFRRIRRMRAHECHSCCFVCVRKMPQLLPFGGSEPSERGV